MTFVSCVLPLCFCSSGPAKWKNDSPSKWHGMAQNDMVNQGTCMVYRYRNPVSCLLNTNESMLDERSPYLA